MLPLGDRPSNVSRNRRSPDAAARADDRDNARRVYVGKQRAQRARDITSVGRRHDVIADAARGEFAEEGDIICGAEDDEASAGGGGAEAVEGGEEGGRRECCVEEEEGPASRQTVAG